MQSRSIFLHPTLWDIGTDSAGRLAVVSNPYSIAQDVACACKTVRGEVMYNTTLGIPYFEELMGMPASTNLLISYLTRESTRLDTVESVNVSIVPDKTNRTNSGYIEITDTNGKRSTIIM